MAVINCVCIINISLLLLGVTFGFPSVASVRRNSRENLQRLENLKADELAEELSGQFEGDIVISQEQLNELLERDTKTGVRDSKYHWPNRLVPYRIKRKDFTEAQLQQIEDGLRTLENVTCIKFVEYQPDAHTNYIWVTGEDGGCWSNVGMQGGRQQLNLKPYAVGSGCFRLYTIVHEFIHALGFHHMQSAANRDKFVRIEWSNIERGKESNFKAYSTKKVDMFGAPYDYGSVMHYSDRAFSFNGNKTIIPLRSLDEGEVLGQRVRMSRHDIDRINAMYCK